MDNYLNRIKKGRLYPERVQSSFLLTKHKFHIKLSDLFIIHMMSERELFSRKSMLLQFTNHTIEKREKGTH